MTTPLVSVIVPVHNGRAFIGDALRSVFGQTHPTIECIVIDDGSTDGTADVVAATAPAAICIRQANSGVSAARNAGSAAASGELLAFLDADDVWLPDKLTAQIEELARSRYPMVMCGAQVVDADLRALGELRMALPAAQPLLGMVLFGSGVRVSCSSTALITRTAFDRLQGFDTNLSTSADWDLLARFLVAFHGVAYVDRPLIKYRVHAGGMSRGISVMERDMRYAYRQLFGRTDLPPALGRRRREAHASMRLMLAGSYWQAGQRAAALRNAGAALAWWPRVAWRLAQRALPVLHSEDRRDETMPLSRTTPPPSTLRRGLLLALLRSSQYLFLFVAGVVVARALGPELRAEYALSLALGSGVWMLVNLSLPEAAGRLLARREASLAQLARLLYAASLVLGVLGAALVLAIGFAAPGSLLQHASTSAIVLAALIVPLTLVQQVSVGLLTRVGAFSAYGWSCALTGALNLALVVALAATLALTPEYALGAGVLALAVRAIVLASAVGRYTGVGGLKAQGSRRLAWRMLKIGLTLHPAYVALALTLRLDLFLVSALTDSRAVGLYSLAIALAEILFLVSWTMTESALRKQTQDDESTAARYTIWVSRQILTVTVPGAAIISLLAYPLIVGLYGREWVGSVLPLAILTCAAVAFAVEGPIRVMMIRMAPPSTIAFAAAAGTVVNVALNLVLIPRLGISGAALASVASYWLYLWLLLRAFRAVTGLAVRPIFRLPREGDVVVDILRRVLPARPGRAS